MITNDGLSDAERARWKELDGLLLARYGAVSASDLFRARVRATIRREHVSQRLSRLPLVLDVAGVTALVVIGALFLPVDVRSATTWFYGSITALVASIGLGLKCYAEFKS